MNPYLSNVSKTAPNKWESIFSGFHFVVTKNPYNHRCHAYCERTGYGFERRNITLIRQHLNDLKTVIKQSNEQI